MDWDFLTYNCPCYWQLWSCVTDLVGLGWLLTPAAKCKWYPGQARVIQRKYFPMSATSLVFYIIHPDSVLLYQNVRTKDEMGQLTKNDFISCSLECLTLNLNIARVCKMWEGAFPRVKCQTQSTLSLVSWVSLAYSSPACRSRHLFSLPGALAQPLGGRMLYFVNFIFLDSPEIPVPARVSLILQDVNPESWIMMNGWHSLLNNPTAT